MAPEVGVIGMRRKADYGSNGGGSCPEVPAGIWIRDSKMEGLVHTTEAVMDVKTIAGDCGRCRMLLSKWLPSDDETAGAGGIGEAAS